jgi:hypothetical protein
MSGVVSSVRTLRERLASSMNLLTRSPMYASEIAMTKSATAQIIVAIPPGPMVLAFP